MTDIPGLKTCVPPAHVQRKYQKRKRDYLRTVLSELEMAYKKNSNIDPCDYMFKVLLLGDAGVGKTSLMWRFSDDMFNHTYISTIGIDFKLRTIDVQGKKVRLQIWDTAGQERFHAISVSYYRTASGIMLIYDISRRRSFENIAKWLRKIDEHAKEDVTKLLIGNKCDIQHPRAVKREEGEQLADEYDMPFFETSAKENESIDEAFECVAKEMLFKFVSGWSAKEQERVTNGAVVDIKKKSRFVRKKEKNCC